MRIDFSKRSRSFKTDERPDDLGKLIYEFDDSHTAYDMSKDRRKRIPKSPGGIFMLCILAFLAGWFLYSFINVTVSSGFLMALLTHLSGFFVLFVAGAIIVLSAFGLWGKFARFAFKHKLARGKNAADRRQLEQLEEQLEEADERKPLRNAISIYEDYIVIVNNGNEKVYDRSRLRGVRLTKYGYGKKVTFTSELGDSAYASAVLNREAVTEINRIFRDYIIKPIKYKYKEPKDRYKHERVRKVRDWQCNTSAGTLVGLTFFMLVIMGVGITLILLHCYVTAQIPVFLGIFFLAGGVLGMFTVYEFVPIIKAFFIPFGFGVLLSVCPMGLLSTIFGAQGIAFTLKSVFGIFSPLSAGIVFLSLMGLLILLYSFVALYKYIRYGDY